MKKKENKN